MPVGAALVGAANVFTATQTINGGDLDLSASANVMRNGTRFLHSFGAPSCGTSCNNTFLGLDAGNFTMTDATNMTALGALTLANNSTGHTNTATGSAALYSNTLGSLNTADGASALGVNTTGMSNTAVGVQALVSNTEGSGNVAVGYRAGRNATTGLNNIYLGANIFGVAGESNTMYLGLLGTQTKTFIAGVRDVTPINPDALPVVIDSAGQLGTMSLSGFATLGANTFSGTQTAPAFVGDGAGVSNVNATLLDGLDSSAFALAAHGHDVTQVTNAARLTGGNTFTGLQTFDAGNIDLDASTGTTGNIMKNGASFLHNVGSQNTFLGLSAGSFGMTGGRNTATGALALAATSTGADNTALGATALQANTIGINNVGIGSDALNDNVNGNDNVAVGVRALEHNTAGVHNIALGTGSLLNTTAGSSNIAIGTSAGSASTGSNNIYVGVALSGVAGESGAMYLGRIGGQTKTVIAGIRGTTVTGGEMVVIDANGRLGSTASVTPGLNSIGSNEVINDSLTGDDLAPNSVGASEVAFNYAGSTSEGGIASNAELLDGIDSTGFASSVHGHNVSQVTNAATLGANTFSATQTIDNGNLDLDPSTSTIGLITKNGTRFLHNFGTFNTFLGLSAGNLTMTGLRNTASGVDALQSNTSGSNNTAIGHLALSLNTTGSSNTASGQGALVKNTEGVQNTASGVSALFNNTTGDYNTASGTFALGANTSGSQNTASGVNALAGNTTGDFNTANGMSALSNNTTGTDNTGNGFFALAINTTGQGNTASGASALALTTGHNNVGVGRTAGYNATTGSNNIYLGANVTGVVGESNTMYLGLVGTQNKTLIAGVRGITTGVANAIPVVIDSNGQLGTISSSRRFKEDINNMPNSLSERLLKLRPVTFRYTQAYADGSKPIQYGLVAEEVAEVFPELAVRNADGQVETVHYETLNVLLLKQFQEQQATLAKQQSELDQLKQQMKDLIQAQNQGR